MKFNLIALSIGTLFGAGLALSGMTDPSVVLGFLNLLGEWNPSLLMVMIGALIITLPAFQFLLNDKNRSKIPILAAKLDLPSATTINRRLIVGAILFGAGWGLAGLCPGPALASISYLYIETVIFIVAMFGGMAVWNNYSD